MSILHCNSINMTENKEKRNSPPLGWPLWLTDEKRLRYQKCCISLPAVFAQIHYFLLSGIHQPSSCTTKVQRWPDVFLMFWLLTLLGTISCLDWGNTWSLISVKLEKKKPPTFCYHSHYECHVSLKTVCLYIMSSLCQTSVNGSRPPHTIPHKKKLWNSLELSNTLIVENVTVAHGGEFICSASSGQMEKSASAFLTVYGGCSENKTPVMLAENFQKVPSQAIIQHSQKICM